MYHCRRYWIATIYFRVRLAQARLHGRAKYVRSESIISWWTIKGGFENKNWNWSNLSRLRASCTLVNRLQATRWWWSRWESCQGASCLWKHRAHWFWIWTRWGTHNGRLSFGVAAFKDISNKICQRIRHAPTSDQKFRGLHSESHSRQHRRYCCLEDSKEKRRCIRDNKLSSWPVPVVW